MGAGVGKVTSGQRLEGREGGSNAHIPGHSRQRKQLGQRPWGGCRFRTLGDSKEANWPSPMGDRQEVGGCYHRGLGLLLPVVGSPGEGREQSSD